MSGEDAIRAAVADAALDPVEQQWLKRLGDADPKPGEKRDGVMAGQWEPGALGLPPDCPVIPLGVDGKTFWFLDTLGQLQALDSKEFSQNNINMLFMGREKYLYWAWPRHDKEGAVTAWRAEKVRECLMGACAQKGPWNSVDRARGRGAWKLDDGRLALHCGTELFVDGKAIGLGELDGCVYMTRPPIMQPAKVLLKTKGPASLLLPLLQSWHWRRPEIDPYLLLGWMAMAALGGAVSWRSVVYVTGDKGTGKSTLQRLIRSTFGNMLLKAADTSAAGIYQLLKQDALPVAIDELEGKADNRKSKAILELARIAASGDVMLRGGSDHQGTQFNARSPFLCSSINPPGLKPQDRSRMAILELRKLKPGAVSPVLDDQQLHRNGRQILRTMMDAWPRFDEVWQWYRQVLANAGHEGRGQDTFGTLLACADILIGDEFGELAFPSHKLDDSAAFWQQHFDAATMAENDASSDNWRACLNHLLGVQIDAWKGGGQQSIGQVADQFWSGKLDFPECKLLLNNAGVSLLKPKDQHDDWRLFVPQNEPKLFRLFLGTDWQGELGSGGWHHALRQCEHEEFDDNAQGRVAGVKHRGTSMTLRLALDRKEKGKAKMSLLQEEF